MSIAHSGKAINGCVSTRRRSKKRMRSTGASSGPVRPSTIKQRCDVAHQQVLDHVHVEQFVAQVADGGEQGDQDRGQAGVEAGLAPGGDFVRPAGEGVGALGVERAEDRRRDKLDDVLGGEERGDRGDGHARKTGRIAAGTAGRYSGRRGRCPPQGGSLHRCRHGAGG